MSVCKLAIEIDDDDTDWVPSAVEERHPSISGVSSFKNMLPYVSPESTPSGGVVLVRAPSDPLLKGLFGKVDGDGVNRNNKAHVSIK